MDILLQDLRFAARGLMRRPAFAVVAAATIALGIGANTAIFSVVNAVLIRPLPYDHPDRLTLVWGTQGTQTNQGVVYADYLDWRRLNRTFADLGAFRGQSVNLTGGDAPDRLIGAFVDASFLRAVNAKLRAAAGCSREAETEVATKAPVAIVSHEAWVTRFGSDPSLVGKQLTINGTSFTVVGITTANMPVPLFAPGPDVMVPIGYYPNAHGLDRGTRGISVVGRLKPGITVATADRDLKAIERQLANDYPTTNANTSADVVALKEFGVAQAKPRLFLMLAAALVVLLIACANVANLQLARGASRTREMSVRAALGAGRVRMARQLLTESIVLSVVGGVIGLAVAFGLTKVLVSLIGSQLPIDQRTITVDGWVVAFALAVSFACGILFGVVPAWKASRTDLTGMLRSRIGAGLGHVSTRNALVVVQLALSLSLLASAGLLARSLMALQHVDPGFDGDRLLTAQFRLPAAKYDTPEKIWTMFDRTVHELRSLPGVEVGGTRARVAAERQRRDVSGNDRGSRRGGGERSASGAGQQHHDRLLPHDAHPRAWRAGYRRRGSRGSVAGGRRQQGVRRQDVAGTSHRSASGSRSAPTTGGRSSASSATRGTSRSTRRRCSRRTCRTRSARRSSRASCCARRAMIRARLRRRFAKPCGAWTRINRSGGSGRCGKISTPS